MAKFTNSEFKLLYPITGLFVFVTWMVHLGEQELIKYKFVPTVINAANLLLFALTLLGLLALISAAKDPNPNVCLLYTSPSPRDRQKTRMPSSA